MIVTFFRSQAFKLFDSDGDGIITSEELRALIEKVFLIMIIIKIMTISIVDKISIIAINILSESLSSSSSSPP